MLRLLKPWKASLPALAFFFVWYWIALCRLDDKGELTLSSFTSGAWFFLGFPFFTIFGLVYAAFIARQVRNRKQWLLWLMISLSIVLLVASIHDSLPVSRLEAIIGKRAARLSRIERLRVADSFNAGITTEGVITGPNELLNLIDQHRSLRKAPKDVIRRPILGEAVPESAECREDDLAVFFRDPATGRIWFRARSGPPRP